MRRARVVQSTKITQFFVSNESTQNNNDTQPEKPKNKRIDFYKECVVKGRSKKSQCIQQNCIEMKSKAMEKLKKQKEKRNQTLIAIQMVEDMLKKKDAKIQSLRTQLQQVQQQVTTNSSINDLYTHFEEEFDKDTLAELRSIDGAIPSDSTFILACVRSIYKHDMNRLKTTSLTGRNRNGQQKQAMSPKKSNVLKKIFDERLNALNLEHNEETKRRSRLNNHIKSAILNAVDSKQSELQQLNDKINSVQKSK